MMNSGNSDQNFLLRIRLRRRLQYTLAIIEQLENLYNRVNMPLADRVRNDILLGNAYRDLYRLQTTSEALGDTARMSTSPVFPQTQTSLDLTSIPTGDFRNLPVPLTSSSLDSIPEKSILEIAIDFYFDALETIEQITYPADKKDDDRKKVEDAINDTILQEKLTKRLLYRETKNSQTVLSTSKPFLPKYHGYWVRPIAYQIPVIGLVMLMILSIISLYVRVPVSRSLGIPPYNCVSGSIIINGSSSLSPLMEIAASEYQNLCSGSTIFINPAKLSSGSPLPAGAPNALNQVTHNIINIATSDAFTDMSLTNLHEYPAAVIVYALVMNSDVTSFSKPDLTSYQIASIYSGIASKWTDINAQWNSEPITLISRPASSYTRINFEKYVLDSIETTSGPPHLESDDMATIANSICSTHGAIGYISLYYYLHYIAQKKQCLHLVTIDHIDSLSENLVENNTYQFWSLGHMYTNGSAEGLTQAFINFLYSDIMQSYLSQFGTYGYLNPADFDQNLLGSH